MYSNYNNYLQSTRFPIFICIIQFTNVYFVNNMSNICKYLVVDMNIGTTYIFYKTRHLFNRF